MNHVEIHHHLEALASLLESNHQGLSRAVNNLPDRFKPPDPALVTETWSTWGRQEREAWQRWFQSTMPGELEAAVRAWRRLLRTFRLMVIGCALVLMLCGGLVAWWIYDTHRILKGATATPFQMEMMLRGYRDYLKEARP